MFPYGNLGVKLSLACFVLFISSINGQNTLEKIEKQCWRQCDSHFSGADCWEKSFSYFSNHLLQSFVDYSNALQNSQMNSKMMDVLNETYINYKSDTDGISDFINDVLSEFDDLFWKTVNKLPNQPIQGQLKEVKCPEKCKQETLTVWIALFGVLMGLTVASILFVAAFVVFSKIQYRKFDKKLLVNASAASS